MNTRRTDWRKRCLRAGLALLAATELGLGLWTQLFPRSFYERVPTVDRYPPFSEHLFRDFGGATLGVGAVLVAAAIYLERRMVLTALTAYALFAVPHAVFHLTDHGHHMTPGELTFQSTSLIIMAVIPLGLLTLVRG